MTEYRRPSFPIATYRDEHGRTIDYGDRWEDSPPDDSYSRVSNQERFAPLHAIAQALIEWLTDTFDVTVEWTIDAAADLLHPPENVLNAARVVPRNSNAAPLTFVLTQFPGVFLHAGSLHDFHFPDCGCDACDDDVASVADELEWTVRCVVLGGYSERFDNWPSRWVEYRLEDPGVGMRSGRVRTQELPKERVAHARATTPTDGRWSPWEPRTN